MSRDIGQGRQGFPLKRGSQPCITPASSLCHLMFKGISLALSKNSLLRLLCSKGSFPQLTFAITQLLRNSDAFARKLRNLRGTPSLTFPQRMTNGSQMSSAPNTKSDSEMPAAEAGPAPKVCQPLLERFGFCHHRRASEDQLRHQSGNCGARG